MSLEFQFNTHPRRGPDASPLVQLFDFNANCVNQAKRPVPVRFPPACPCLGCTFSPIHYPSDPPSPKISCTGLGPPDRNQRGRAQRGGKIKARKTYRNTEGRTSEFGKTEGRKAASLTIDNPFRNPRHTLSDQVISRLEPRLDDIGVGLARAPGGMVLGKTWRAPAPFMPQFAYDTFPCGILVFSELFPYDQGAFLPTSLLIDD